MSTTTNLARLLGPSRLETQAALRTEAHRSLETNRLAEYRPYPKQLEFHRLGVTKRERLLRAGNQDGKTFCGGHELAYHLTGLYPPWWPGRRFLKRAPVCWAASDTAETTRDNPQRQLVGQIAEDFGTGTIPARLLGNKAIASGTSDLLDYIRVWHAPSQSWSLLKFKYYAQGRQKWQGPPIDVIWCDEEPDDKIYGEALARLTATDGCLMLTATPLLGMSTIMRKYLMDKSEDRAEVNMTIEDAEHIPPENRAKIIAGFPAHEREARAKGIPMLGSGRIYPVAEEVFAVEAFKSPSDWMELAALDFGPWDHPTAAVHLLWNPDPDVVYIINAYRRREAIIPVHASSLKAWGQKLPFAWPADMHKKAPESGIQYMVQYRNEGLEMLPDHAQWTETKVKHENLSSTVAVEPGISDILSRLETGRLKVFKHLNDWFEEYRLYHREEGQIVKELDDLMDATRYGIMMLRYARKVMLTQAKLSMPRRARGLL